MLALAGVVEYLTHVALTVRHEKRSHIRTATEISPEIQTVTTLTPDGLKLSAWWWPATGNQGEPVILVHGLGGTRADMWRAMKLVHDQGRNALAIDLRGHGQSAPAQPSFGWREKQDVKAWMTWLASREKREVHPLLWGTSMGAVTCLLAAAEDPRAGGVIADAPFDNLTHTLDRHASLYYSGLINPPLVSLVAWRIGAEDHLPVAEVDCVRAVRKIHVPVLLIAGELDQRMPPGDVRRIYEAANKPKAWFVVANAGHSFRPFNDDFRAAVIAFLKRG